MARRVPSVEIATWEANLIAQKLLPARVQAAPWIIKCGNVTIRSCSGKSTFPTRAAAACALSHTLKRAVRWCDELRELTQRSRIVAQGAGSYGSNCWGLVLSRKLISMGVISIVRADATA